MDAAVIVGVLEIVLGVWIIVLYRQRWFEGGKSAETARRARVLALSMLGIAAASLLSFSAAYFISTPQVHGVVLAVALAALAAWGMVRLRARGPRPAAVNAETGSGGWTVINTHPARPRAPLRSGYAGASPTVRNIESMEVQP